MHGGFPDDAAASGLTRTGMGARACRSWMALFV